MDWCAAGGVVFVSGCTGEGASVEEQVTGALDRTRHALEAAGSSMDNVVKTFFLLTSLGDYARVRQTETEYYERHAPQLVTTPPAATLMVVPGLGRPEALVEYEAIGALDRRDVTYYPEFWGGKELAYPHVPKEHAKFARSQAIGNLLFVSGCQALDHDTVRVETDDFAEQTRIVLDKVRVAMDEVGSGLAGVLKTTVFVKDEAMLLRYRELEREYFGERPPPSAVFVVSELPRPEFLVEVEAVGLVDTSVPSDLLFLPAGEGDTLEAALDATRTALERAGSSLEDVVKTTIAARDPAERHARGATTFLQTAAGAPFQIDVTAILTGPAPGG